MRESTNESSRNKATITFNHSLRIVVADFLVNKPLTLEQLDRLFLFAYWSVNHVKQQNKHALCEFQPKLQFMKRNERLQNVKIRTPLTGLCPNDTRLVEFIYSDCAKSAACHLEVNTSTAPLRAQCVACGCLTADRGPPKRSLLYSLHDIYTSQITHNNFFYNEKKTGFTFPHSMLWPIYTETTLKPLRASAL